jgi:ElaB/YqjD/DUF883 family membrane-anchored ribosome-binding protein
MSAQLNPTIANAPTTAAGAQVVEKFADHAAAKTDNMIESTRQATNSALDSMQSGVETLRTAAPTALTRAAAQVEELTRRSMERAHDASIQVREQAQAAGDKTVGYVRAEPVKSMLMAAAAGAAAAALIGWLASSRRAPRA